MLGDEQTQELRKNLYEHAERQGLELTNQVHRISHFVFCLFILLPSLSSYSFRCSPSFFVHVNFYFFSSFLTPFFLSFPFPLFLQSKYWLEKLLPGLTLGALFVNKCHQRWQSAEQLLGFKDSYPRHVNGFAVSAPNNQDGVGCGAHKFLKECCRRFWPCNGGCGGGSRGSEAS